MNIWGEIRNEFDDDNNVVHIYGYLTADDNESPNVIAKVDMNTLEVEYIDPRAKTDGYAQDMINEAIEDI